CQTIETGRRNANHLKWMTAEGKFATEYVWPSTELPLPESIAQDHTLRAASMVIVGWRDQATYDWLNLKNIKEISAHQQSICVVGFSTLPEIESIGGPRRYCGESLLLVMQSFPQTTCQIGIARVEVSPAKMRRVHNCNPSKPI